MYFAILKMACLHGCFYSLRCFLRATAKQHKAMLHMSLRLFLLRYATPAKAIVHFFQPLLLRGSARRGRRSAF